MFAHGFKWHFIRILSVFFAALCLLSSTTSHGQDEDNSAPPPTPSTTQTDTNSPPVEQSLVPEGVFAMQLAEALKLDPVPDEAKAEELLSGLGIEPQNGWIAEYPVTPAVLGDIEKGISVASDQGKIALTKEQALKLVGDVKARLGFDVNQGPNAPATLNKKRGNTTIYSYTDTKGITHFADVYDSIPKEYQKNVKIMSRLTLHELSGVAGSGTTEATELQPMANPNPEAINGYYVDQGPPAVTYYSPPDPYYYLYSWVPYPFWSTGYYFPGFFVLNNFHRHVFFNHHPFFVTHHGGSGGAIQRPLNVGPVYRNWRGHLTHEGMAHSPWFSSPNAQSGARAIVTLNQNRNRSMNGTAVSRMDVSRHPFSSTGNSGTLSNAPVVPTGRITMQNNLYRPTPYSGGRVFNQPAFNLRAYVPDTPRFYHPPAFDQNRAFRLHESFGNNVPDGFHRSWEGGEFHGGGNFTRPGGSFAGASRGGHR